MWNRRWPQVAAAGRRGVQPERHHVGPEQAEHVADRPHELEFAGAPAHGLGHVQRGDQPGQGLGQQLRRWAGPCAPGSPPRRAPSCPGGCSNRTWPKSTPHFSANFSPVCAGRPSASTHMRWGGPDLGLALVGLGLGQAVDAPGQLARRIEALGLQLRLELLAHEGEDARRRTRRTSGRRKRAGISSQWISRSRVRVALMPSPPLPGLRVRPVPCSTWARAQAQARSRMRLMMPGRSVVETAPRASRTLKVWLILSACS